MEMKGGRHIAAPRTIVWEKLNDPDTLKICIPGCQELTGSKDEGFEAVVKQKVGPVRATFKGKVELRDVIEMQSYTISGSGKGGVAGFANGDAQVMLTDAEDGGTELTYDVQAKLGGKLAQLGGRLSGSGAKKLSDEFFDRFKAEVET